MKTTTNIIYAVIALVAFACFALLPRAQGVVPAPDGSYAGGNTAEGQNALFSLTTGGFNTALGFLSLRNNITGQFNTAIGAGTLLANNADENTATGFGALLSNTTGSQNAANGGFALFNNTDGNDNTAFGFQALFNNTTGFQNTANGAFALFSNTIGHGNTAVGAAALESNTSGGGNTALGFNAGVNVTTANNVICIGADGNNVDNSCYIGNIFNSTSSGGTAVFVNSNGRLGTATSSRRFKEEIKPMEGASEALFALKPVTFCYKKEIDPAGTPQLGLVAEDVEKVNPDLVVRDKEGKPYSVRYDQVNAMLLNEFLKEHKAFIEEQQKVEKLQATVANLLTTVKEQAAQIHKVCAQVEVSKPEPQTVLSSRQ